MANNSIVVSEITLRTRWPGVVVSRVVTQQSYFPKLKNFLNTTFKKYIVLS